MTETKLLRCKCGRMPIIEYWCSGGAMFMVKCPNPVCDVPPDGYPTGQNLQEVKQEWNRRHEHES